MRNEVLYFNPQCKWADINTENVDTLIDEYKKRIIGYYLSPSEELLKSENFRNNGFAVGILSLTAIEAVGQFQTSSNDYGNRFRSFINGTPEFNGLENRQRDTIIKTIVEAFRNGLLHNGRIKNACEFSFDLQGLYDLSGTTLVINPRQLFDFVSSNMLLYFDNLKTSDSEKIRFKKKFETIFSKELNEF